MHAVSLTMCVVCVAQYDRDNDSKLSFEEWQRYADEDRDVSAFVDNMSALIPAR